MQLTYFHLCDYAFTSNGKMGLIGIFNRITARELPYTHRTAYLAYELEFEAAEFGQNPTHIRVTLRDQDGGEMRDWQMMIKTQGNVPPGERPRAGSILPLADLKFEKAGTHEFAVWVNKQHLKSLPVVVVHPEPNSQRGA